MKQYHAFKEANIISLNYLYDRNMFTRSLHFCCYYLFCTVFVRSCSKFGLAFQLSPTPTSVKVVTLQQVHRIKPIGRYLTESSIALQQIYAPTRFQQQQQFTIRCMFNKKSPAALPSISITSTSLSSSSSSSSRTILKSPTANVLSEHSNPTGTSANRGIIGDFEEIEGNFVLRPPAGEQPRALIHFLGGALVGAAPHISYRYLLERLAQSGYLIVATPYQLSFDYLSTCDVVISRFERIALPLARAYGALPVVGIGHSCGSLLHVLITSLFPDTPRAANALISFNNKPISEAVPFFEEFFAPFFTYVSAPNTTDRHSGSEIILTGLELAKAAVVGEIPSDEMLTKASKFLVPKGMTGIGGPFANLPPVAVPVAFRTAFTTFSAPYTMAVKQAGITPILSEVIGALEQIPYLIDEVGNGARDFTPPPASVKMAVRRSYRARRTLVLQYTEDPIDESNDIEELLKAASQVIRMKRPIMTGPTIDVQRRNLPGGHASPLLAPPLDVAEQVESLLGQETAKERFLYAEADQTVDVLVRWLEESNL